MKNNIILLIVLLIPLLFIKIPKYQELNNLKIINKIEIKCIDNNYLLTLYELYPKKNNTSILIKTKKETIKGNNLITLKNRLENKKYYFKKIKKIKTNCSNLNQILNSFNLKIKK